MSRNLKQEPFRIGILGCGVFAQRRILSALAETPEVLVIDLQKRDPDEAKVVAKRFGIQHSCSTREQLLSNSDIEGVFICTLNPSHEEDAIACAKAGKHAICEKPLALEAEAVVRMIDTFREVNKKFLVGHCARFKPAIRRARDFIRNKKMGELLGLRAFFSFQPPAYNWRYDWNQGGGAFRDIGIHAIDFVRFVTGEEIVAVQAMADAQFDPANGRADISGRAILRVESGVMAEISVSFDQIGRNGFEVIGNEGILMGWHSFRPGNDPGEHLRFFNEVGFSEISLPKNNMYAEELCHFAEVASNEVAPVIAAEEGLANQRVLDAIYQSVAEKREIELSAGD